MLAGTIAPENRSCDSATALLPPDEEGPRELGAEISVDSRSSDEPQRSDGSQVRRGTVSSQSTTYDALCKHPGRILHSGAPAAATTPATVCQSPC